MLDRAAELGLRAPAARSRPAWLDGSIGECLEKCVAESLFATLAARTPRPAHLDPREQLANAVFAYLGGFYNLRRRHSALGYRNPADYETACHRKQLTTAA